MKSILYAILGVILFATPAATVALIPGEQVALGVILGLPCGVVAGFLFFQAARETRLTR